MAPPRRPAHLSIGLRPWCGALPRALPLQRRLLILASHLNNQERILFLRPEVSVKEKPRIIERAEPRTRGGAHSQGGPDGGAEPRLTTGGEAAAKGTHVEVEVPIHRKLVMSLFFHTFGGVPCFLHPGGVFMFIAGVAMSVILLPSFPHSRWHS